MYIFMYIFVCTYVCIYIYVNVCTCTYIHIFVYIYIHIYINLDIHLWAMFMYTFVMHMYMSLWHINSVFHELIWHHDKQCTYIYIFLVHCETKFSLKMFFFFGLFVVCEDSVCSQFFQLQTCVKKNIFHCFVQRWKPIFLRLVEGELQASGNVCMHISVYISVYVHKCVVMHTKYVYVCTYICMYFYICIHTYIYICL